MNIQDLAGVKVKLYEIFNEAVERHTRYSVSGRGTNEMTRIHISIGEIGQAIVAAEREEREANGVRYQPLSGKSSKPLQKNN